VAGSIVRSPAQVKSHGGINESPTLLVRPATNHSTGSQVRKELIGNSAPEPVRTENKKWEASLRRNTTELAIVLRPLQHMVRTATVAGIARLKKCFKYIIGIGTEQTTNQ
jgi:hypothetical protein